MERSRLKVLMSLSSQPHSDMVGTAFPFYYVPDTKVDAVSFHIRPTRAVLSLFLSSPPTVIAARKAGYKVIIINIYR